MKRWPLALILLTGAGAYPGVALATPVAGPHETVDITASTTQPNTSTGFGYAASYKNPSNPAADPPALRRLTIGLPAGTRVDTSVRPQCTASDAQLRALGDGACPAGSRIGSGQATADIVGFGRMTFNTTLFNAPNQQIELVESGSSAGAYGVVRTFVHGNTLDGPVPTCLAGGNPPTGCPSDQVILLNNHLATPAITANGGSYGTTPATCPLSGEWQGPVTFYYGDGTVETVRYQVRCTRPAPVVLPRRARCGRPRSLTIRIRSLPGDRIRAVVVRVDGRRFFVLRGRGLRGPIRLRGLPRNRFRLVVVVRMRSGTTLRSARTYRRCRAVRGYVRK